jgi:hypothetical protein
VKQGGKVRRPVRGFSSINKKNIDYADKLAHIKACNALSPKLIKQSASIENPLFEVQLMLQIFAEVINAFKKFKYRVDYEIFSNWDQLRIFLKTNAVTLPNEAGAVKAKIDRLQFDIGNIRRLTKEFDTNIKCKITSGNCKGIMVIYKFLQSTFTILACRIYENDKSVSKSRDRS